MSLGATALKAIMPRCDAGLWCEPLDKAMTEFGITYPLRMAAFLAQLAHESVELTVVEENLNYSAPGLLKTFPKYFTVETDAELYAHKPEAIANRVYANRLGNGSESSGDGWFYRGRGPIQLTGKDNYQAAQDVLGVPLVKYPAYAMTPDTGSRIAGWFWDTHKLNPLADAGDMVEITKRINGGLNGLAHRLAYYEKAKRTLVA